MERLKGHEGAVVALERQGRSLYSIGKVAGDGPLGLATEVLERAECRLSFSKLTFPHQMMRMTLLEQIYGGMRIMRKEPYHR